VEHRPVFGSVGAGCGVRQSAVREEHAEEFAMQRSNVAVLAMRRTFANAESLQESVGHP